MSKTDNKENVSRLDSVNDTQLGINHIVIRDSYVAWMSIFKNVNRLYKRATGKKNNYDLIACCCDFLFFRYLKETFRKRGKRSSCASEEELARDLEDLRPKLLGEMRRKLKFEVRDSEDIRKFDRILSEAIKFVNYIVVVRPIGCFFNYKNGKAFSPQLCQVRNPPKDGLDKETQLKVLFSLFPGYMADDAVFVKCRTICEKVDEETFDSLKMTKKDSLVEENKYFYKPKRKRKHQRIKSDYSSSEGSSDSSDEDSSDDSDSDEDEEESSSEESSSEEGSSSESESESDHKKKKEKKKKKVKKPMIPDKLYGAPKVEEEPDVEWDFGGGDGGGEEEKAEDPGDRGDDEAWGFEKKKERRRKRKEKARQKVEKAKESSEEGDKESVEEKGDDEEQKERLKKLKKQKKKRKKKNKIRDRTFSGLVDLDDGESIDSPVKQQVKESDEVFEEKKEKEPETIASSIDNALPPLEPLPPEETPKAPDHTKLIFRPPEAPNSNDLLFKPSGEVPDLSNLTFREFTYEEEGGEPGSPVKSRKMSATLDLDWLKRYVQDDVEWKKVQDQKWLDFVNKEHKRRKKKGEYKAKSQEMDEKRQAIKRSSTAVDIRNKVVEAVAKISGGHNSQILKAIKEDDSTDQILKEFKAERKKMKEKISKLIDSRKAMEKEMSKRRKLEDERNKKQFKLIREVLLKVDEFSKDIVVQKEVDEQIRGELMRKVKDQEEMIWKLKAEVEKSKKEMAKFQFYRKHYMKSAQAKKEKKKKQKKKKSGRGGDSSSDSSDKE